MTHFLWTTIVIILSFLPTQDSLDENHNLVEKMSLVDVVDLEIFNVEETKKKQISIVENQILRDSITISSNVNELTDADVINLTKPVCETVQGNYGNGLFPDNALCSVGGQHKLQPEAARSFIALSDAYKREHGKNICFTDTYRSFEAQMIAKNNKPALTAKPGTSKHGLGLAVDFCFDSFDDSDYIWLKNNADLYGFIHPVWAEPNGSKPEPWHWEFKQ